MNLNEIKLFEPIKRFWEIAGFKVYCEIPESGRGIDVVALKDSQIVAIELKVGYCKKAFRQAYMNCLYTDRSYIAVKSKPHIKNILKCHQNNIGILLVGDTIKILSEAIENNPSKYHRERIKESCSHNKDNNIAGLPCQKGIGPAISVNKSVKEYLQRNPDAKWKQIFIDVPNHYASPASMKQSLEKHRHFEYLKDKNKDNRCGECRRQKTYSCPKGVRRKDTSKACINFDRAEKLLHREEI
jgi:hypothetical protein